jgi:hypothetical protein
MSRDLDFEVSPVFAYFVRNKAMVETVCVLKNNLVPIWTSQISKIGMIAGRFR